MSQLLDQLRRSAIVPEPALQSALRRQQIYGGSLDTVLLELDLLDAPTLAGQIAAANRCDDAPIHWIDSPPADHERPWDALPPALLELGWAMPLRREGERVQIVVHPEIPPEQRAALELAVGQLQVFSTCEACVAKLAAERRSSVMPQRYAVLALKWKLAMVRAYPAETEPHTVPPTRDQDLSASGSPMTDEGPMFAPLVPLIGPSMLIMPSATERYSVPSPESLQADAMISMISEISMISDSETSEVPQSKPRSTLIYNLAAVAEDERVARRSFESAMAGPSAVPSETSPSADVSELGRRLVEPRRVLEQAMGRDQATDALVRAAMQLSPRAALFGVKREGLRGIAGPGTIPDLDTQLIETSPAIDAAVDGRTPMSRAVDLDLRIAVSQEMAVPCVFLPITVQGRAVLMLYIDRDGAEFAPGEVELARDLCVLAGRTLEEVLRKIRSDAGKPTPIAKLEPTPVSAPKPVTVVPTSVPVVPTSVPGSASSSGSFAFRPPPTLAPPPALTSRPPAASTIRVPPSVPPSAPLVVPTIGIGTRTLPGAHPVPAPKLPPVVPPLPLSAPVGANATLPAMTTMAGVSSPLPTSQPLPPLPTAPLPPISHGADKPPVRLRRADEPNGVPVTRPGLTALGAPLGDAGSVRGRIVIDDEDDRQHANPDVGVGIEAIDSAIVAAMRGGSSAIVHLRAFGEPAYRRILKQFPGELDVHRRDLDTLPPLPAHGALIRVALELPELGPYLLEVIDHPNPTVRFYVAFVFMELRHTRAVGALGELAFDPDADVRAIAMRVLETYSGELGFAEAVAVIRRELDSPNRTRQLHATRAVGTVRDITAVPKLIDLLTNKERFIQESALESLCSITGQQLGLKPHRWRSWYADNAHHHRVEWIISSLAHKDLSVRRWAADELRRITGQRINFLAAGSKQEREIGIRKWIEWWTERGRAEYAG